MPQLALTHLRLCGSQHTTAADVQRACTALRTHACTLRSVELEGRKLARMQEPFAALLDALCTCNKLVYLKLDFHNAHEPRLEGTHAFAAVANSLRAAGTLRHLVLDGYVEELFSVGTGPDGATVASVLLPAGLEQLDIEGANWTFMSDACKSALARALHHNTTLRGLKLHKVIDMPVRADNDIESDDSAEEEEDYDDPQRLLPLRVALATTQLQRLDVMTGPCGLCSVAALTASGALPASLQELCLFDHSDDPVWAAQLPLLFSCRCCSPAGAALADAGPRRGLPTGHRGRACVRAPAAVSCCSTTAVAGVDGALHVPSAHAGGVRRHGGRAVRQCDAHIAAPQ
jgi:hypothetical protein